MCSSDLFPSHDRLQFTGSLVFISKIKDEYFDIDKFLEGVC